MTDDDKVNVIIAVAFIFALAIIVPARLQEHDDAAFNYGVKKPFLDHGVKLP